MIRNLTPPPFPVWPSEPAGLMWLRIGLGAAGFSFMMIGVGAFISIWGN